MSAAIVYCGSCRRRITNEELETGATVAFDNQLFCADCRAKLLKCEFARTEVPKPLFHAPTDPEALLKKPLEGFAGRRSGTKRHAARPAGRSTGQRKTGRSGPSRMVVAGGIMLGIGALFMAVLLVVGVKPNGNGSGDRVAPSAPTGAGKPLPVPDLPLLPLPVPVAKGTEPSTPAPATAPAGPIEPDPPVRDPANTVEPSSPPAQDKAEPPFQPASPVQLDALDGTALAGLEGKEAHVRGSLTRCMWNRSNSVLYLNFSDDRDSFYLVLFRTSTPCFEDAFGEPVEKKLQGRTVVVSGTVQRYRGRLQIRLENPSQLRIVD